MPKTELKKGAKMEDVLFHPKHWKHLSLWHGQTNWNCISKTYRQKFKRKL